MFNNSIRNQSCPDVPTMANPSSDIFLDYHVEVRKLDDHYYVRVGCQEGICHTQDELVKGLKELVDQFVGK